MVLGCRERSPSLERLLAADECCRYAAGVPGEGSSRDPRPVFNQGYSSIAL